MDFPKKAPISESINAKSRGRLRDNHYGNPYYKDVVEIPGADGHFSPSLPLPMGPLSEAIFGLCCQAKVAFRGSREGPQTSTIDRKKKTKEKPASVKSENFYRSSPPKKTLLTLSAVVVHGLPTSPPT